MPKMATKDRVRRSELPDTLKRSGRKAQRTFAKAHDAAAEQYGEGERAHRTAMAALKRTHEKRGDRWVQKREPGPSDPRSEASSVRRTIRFPSIRSGRSARVSWNPGCRSATSSPA